jgi:hypothetical protein
LFGIPHMIVERSETIREIVLSMTLATCRQS